MDKVKRHLNLNYELRYNEVLGRPEIRKVKHAGNFKLIDKYVLNSLLVELVSEGIACSRDTLRTLLESNFVDKYNPFREYIEALPQWDGVDHIAALASTISTHDDDFFKWALGKWLVAMVACATDEAVTNHQVLILIGEQGVGKTTWLLRLIPAKLKEYVFAGSINPSNKDTTLLMSERILIIMDELSSYTPSKVDAFKELITRGVISERRAYGYFTENYVRRASFAGSANHSQVLMDSTGNRRFLVIKALSINLVHQVDMEQVYAQAKHLLANEFKYYFHGEEIQRIEQNNEQFRQISSEEEYLLKYFSSDSQDQTAVPVHLSATEVIDWIKTSSGYRGSFNSIAMGKILTRSGFEHKKVDGLKKYILYKKDVK